MEATRLLDAGCLGRLGRPLPGPYAPFGTPMAPYSMAAYPPHHVPYSIDGILHGSHAAAASHHGGPLGLVMASSPGHAALVGSRAAVLSHRIAAAAAQHHHQEAQHQQQQHHQAAPRVSSHRSKFEFSMCDISARMHCLAERSKIGQTVTGKYANAMRVSNSTAAATARPTFFRFISFETSAPNLQQTVPKGDAASVRVVRSTPAKQRRNARVAVASVSTVRD
ncbi:hypothetical protein HPB50_024829 [Hyalomma asiaticum]|uniref:Uncharacterized protein n=1 Tax=Hyalomma asiaticum TaxID=266040 RepID=A0ACB7T9D8_HYAAI|nr:hypothetical protein HPB50_024829 [Hyalomma asiaticum]